MKTSLPAALLPLVLVVAHGVARAGFTYETPTELSSQADFNNDGHPDLAVFDRETGVLRILSSLSGVSFSASANFWTGLDNVDSLSAGTLTGGRGAVALASSSDNRVRTVVPLTSNHQEIDFGNRLHPGTLVVTSLLSGQVPGSPGLAGNLFISTDYNDFPSPRQLSRMALGLTGTVTFLDAGNSPTSRPDPFRRGNALPWHGRTALGFIMEGSAGNSFLLQQGFTDPRQGLTSLLPDLPPASHWLHADFASQAGRTALLFYQKSASAFHAQDAHSASATAAATFTGFPSQDLGAPIHLLMTVVRENAQDRLLALLDGGARAVLYDYTNGSAPVVRQSWTAPAGEAFTMAAPLANGSFLLLSGQGGRSMNWQRYDAEGNSHRKTIAGPFGCKSLQSRHATLFYFSQEPFVNANAVLRRMIREPDWTDIGSGLLTPLTRYTDGGPRTGLSNPSGFLSTGNFDGSVAVTNQFTRTATAGQAPISITTLSNRSGNVDAAVHFDPPAGTYPPLRPTVTPQGPDDPIQPLAGTFPVSLSTATPAGILYRFSADQPWQTYTQPVALTGSATLQARVAGVHLVRTASYQFEPPASSSAPLTLPPAPDADGNGLPDDWEAAFAQSNPAADTDGDGLTALQEYQNGTDPRDNFSVTPPTPVVPSPDFPLALSMETVPVSGGGSALRLLWSASLSDALLQSTGDLQNWSAVTENIAIEGTRIVHTSPLPGPPATTTPARRFYRLVRVDACP